MKKFMYLLVVLFIALMLSISACGGDDDDNGLTEIPDITPENYDWDIYILDTMDTGRTSSYFVSADWLGSSSALSPDDVISIQFDSHTPVVLFNYGWGDEWYFIGSAQLNPGTSYSVKLLKNNSQQASVTVKTPYRCYANFPSLYNPNNSAELTWSLEHNSQFQIAGVSSYGPGYTEEDDEMAWLEPSARTHTIPANAVDNYGEETEYELLVIQYGFAKSGRMAVMTAQGQSRSYPEEIAKENQLSQQLDLLKKLRRNM